MIKPNNYDETQVQGEFKPVELGGHKMIIKQVSEMKSKNGQNMIVVLFDFDKSDKQAEYFMEMFKNDIRPDKKWPNQATQYVLVNDNEGKTNKSFKTFCTCVEHSNPGFTIQWGDNWGEQFKNKKIGGVFGEQMDFYNGKGTKKRVLRWFISLDRVTDAAIPEITETKAYKDNKNNSSTTNGTADFMNIPDGINEELPFN